MLDCRCVQALSGVAGGALEDIVSLTPIGEPRHKITVSSLREKKFQHQPITCLTAYDYASARLVAGIRLGLELDDLNLFETGLLRRAMSWR